MSETLRIIPQGQPRAEVDNVAEPPCCQEFETGQELISRLHGPSHGYGSGSGNFLDAEARKQSQYGFQLVVGTRSLDGKLIKTHINDFAAENIHDARISLRLLSSALTRNTTISRSTTAVSANSTTLMTLTSLRSCLMICSTI